jgi:hypothetical protein
VVADAELMAGPEPEISVDQELQDGLTFIGQIVIDAWTKGRDGQFQWQVGVKPFGMAVKNDEGILSSWSNVSTQKNSKMGKQIEAFKRVFGPFRPGTQDKYQLGKGHYLDHVAVYQMKTLEFGRNDEGEKITARVIIPLKHATPEEVGEAQANMPSVQNGAVVAAASNVSLTGEQTETLVSLFDGKNGSQGQLAAAKAGLEPAVKQFVMSGAAHRHLVESGDMTKDGDTYQRV